MKIGELLISISEKCKHIANEKEQDSFITDSIFNYMTDINNIGKGTEILVEVK